MLSDASVARFWQRVQRTDGCWEFMGARSAGYGVLHLEGTRYKAHHLSVRIAGLSIPAGSVVMHLCDNRACVRPEHLRVASQSENIKDMWDKQRRPRPTKTHCVRGHEFTPENTATASKKTGSYKLCKECRRVQALARYHRTKKLKGDN